MSLTLQSIVAPERTYELHSPMMCQVEKEDGVLIISNDLYDLYAAGENSDEAEHNFYIEFDVAYQHLTTVPDAQLSDRLIRAKRAFNLIVKSITNA